MKDKTRRTARLERLMRVREVARMTALERVSGAEQAFARLSGVASRSNALAADYASSAARPDVHDAASLQNLRAYHGGIAQLSADAARNTLAARQTADAEQILLARAERSRDLVEKRLTADRQAAAKAKTASLIAAGAHLARSLNSKR